MVVISTHAIGSGSLSTQAGVALREKIELHKTEDCLESKVGRMSWSRAPIKKHKDAGVEPDSADGRAQLKTPRQG